MKKVLIFTLVALIMAFSAFGATNYLTILHVNDTHGHAWRFSPYGNPDIGGFSAISTLVDQIKAEVRQNGGEVLFLHAGDVNTGVPESDQLDAAPDIVALNMLGLDVFTLGNHEFDKSREVLDKQMALAKFPMISANIYNSKDENPVTPYVIKDLNGLKVALYGLTTEETAILEPIYLGDWRFEDAVKVSENLIPKLEEEADIIVALTHLGYEENDSPGRTTSNELAQAVEGIDVIVDGHSHTLFEEAPVYGDTILVQAGDWGKYLGRLDLVIVDGKVVSHKWQAIPINFKQGVKDSEGNTVYVCPDGEIAQDPKVLATMNYFYELGSEKLNEKIGETKINLDGERNDVRSKDTNLTNLIADGMIWKTDADIALQNGGGVRASIKPGEISYRDVLTVLPFGNTTYVMNLTGKEVMDLLEYVVSVPAGKGAFGHFGGLTFVYENNEIKDVMVGKESLDLNKTYKFVTNNYVAMGGDGYAVLAKIANGYDTGFVDADVMREYIIHLGTIEGYDGSQRMVKK